jgi:hypothetical protein
MNPVAATIPNPFMIPKNLTATAPTSCRLARGAVAMLNRPKAIFHSPQHQKRSTKRNDDKKTTVTAHGEVSEAVRGDAGKPKRCAGILSQPAPGSHIQHCCIDV